MKNNLVFLTVLCTLFSCVRYTGPLYEVEIQHTGKDFEQIDTLVMAWPELNDYRLTADDNSTRVIYNVRSFRILRKIKNSNSDSILKKQNKKCLW